MAKTYLESSDVNFRVANNNTTVIGTTALTDRVLIDSGVTGVNLGSTVEKVDFSGSIANYKFKQGFGSAIDVYDMNNQKVASMISVTDKHLVFSDGSAALAYTGGKVMVGGKALTTTIAGVTDAVLDATDISLSGGIRTVAINASGTTVATTAEEVFNISAASTYSNTITGFDFNKDKLSLGSGVTATAVNIVNSADDGVASFTYSANNGVHAVTITLTGLTSVQDTNLTTTSGWNAIFA